MITLLLGTNALAKKQRIVQTAKELQAEVENFTENSTIPSLSELFEPQLFGSQKIVVFDHVWKQLDPENLLEKIGNKTSAQLFILEDSLDKRKKINQDFLKDNRVTVEELNSPVGTRLATEWIQNFASEQGIKIEPAAAMTLSRALLIDEDSVLNVAQAQSELQKLKSYANGQVITSKVVSELVESATGVDIFVLLNAIATKNKKTIFAVARRLFCYRSGG
jgi:DNA polymerase III delta subunit